MKRAPVVATETLSSELMEVDDPTHQPAAATRAAVVDDARSSGQKRGSVVVSTDATVEHNKVGGTVA
jgi:hypothetical protein